MEDGAYNLKRGSFPISFPPYPVNCLCFHFGSSTPLHCVPGSCARSSLSHVMFPAPTSDLHSPMLCFQLPLHIFTLPCYVSSSHFRFSLSHVMFPAPISDLHSPMLCFQFPLQIFCSHVMFPAPTSDLHSPMLCFQLPLQIFTLPCYVSSSHFRSSLSHVMFPVPTSDLPFPCLIEYPYTGAPAKRNWYRWRKCFQSPCNWFALFLSCQWLRGAGEISTMYPLLRGADEISTVCPLLRGAGEISSVPTVEGCW